MRSYTVQENHIGSAVSEILWFTHADRDKDPNTFIRIILLFRITIHASGGDWAMAYIQIKQIGFL